MTATENPVLEAPSGEPSAFDSIVHLGFDTFAASRRAPAVKGDATLINGSESCSYTLCETSEALRETLKMSVDVTADFGVGQVDAKTEYVKSLQLTSTSIVIALYSNVVKGTYSSMGANLDPEINAPTAAELNSFYQSYGDSYISELSFGGEYIATYTFYCETITEQETIKSALAAKGVVERGDITAQVQNGIESVQNSQIVRSDFKQTLNGYSDLKWPDPDATVDFALSLPTQILTAPTVISISTTGYEHVPEIKHDVWLIIIGNRNKFQDDESRQGVNAVGSALDQLVTQIRWINEVYRTYGYTGDDVLTKRLKQAGLEVNVFTDLLERICEDPTQPFSVPSFESLAWGQPVLTFEGPSNPVVWGEGGTDSFSSITRPDIINRVFIEKIQLWTGDRVDELAVWNSNGKNWNAYGSPGGNYSNILSLSSGQFVTDISGRCGRRVDYLAIECSKNGQAIAGGGGGGDPFTSWKAPLGSVVVGFTGTSGGRVDSVGPLICTFERATWNTK